MSDVRINGKAAWRFAAFSLFVIVVVLALLGWQVEQRNDAIHEIREAADRIEVAAVHTEEVLVEVVEERDTPEAIAQSERVAQALDDIASVKAMLCDLPEFTEDPRC
jgi:cytochrome oxidase assembly protein ShyY1